MKKNFWKIAIKVIAAGVATFVFLNLVCMFYYNVPIRCESKTLSTDYCWEGGKFYSRGTEGFANGVLDENGFNNLSALNKGEIEILLMGSSHMEAFNVAQDKNAVAMLNSKFEENGIDLKAYNIGVSGHSLLSCLNNLSNALEEFAPEKYVVVEVQNISFNPDNIQKLLNGTFKRQEAKSNGIMGVLQRFPYLRLIYAQIQNAQENNEVEKKTYTVKDGYDLLDTVIKNGQKECAEAGVKLAILYNCSVTFDEYGDVTDRKNADDVKTFKEICEKNDVVFIDMYDAFKDNYIKTNKLPRGFTNTEIGTGHINEEGHRVISEKLFDEIAK